MDNVCIKQAKKKEKEKRNEIYLHLILQITHEKQDVNTLKL